MNSPLTWREADIGSEAVLPDTDIPAAPEPQGSQGQDSPKTTENDSSSDRLQPPPAQPGKAKLIAVTAIVVIIALVAGAFIYAIILQGNEGEPQVHTGYSGNNTGSNHDPDTHGVTNANSSDYGSIPHPRPH